MFPVSLTFVVVLVVLAGIPCRAFPSLGMVVAEDNTHEMLEKAEKVTELMKEISEFSEKIHVDKMSKALEGLAAFGPGIGVVGGVISLVASFLPSDTEKIIGKLDKIQEQLARLEFLLEKYFTDLKVTIKVEACKTKYFPIESMITQATRSLLRYQSVRTADTKDRFLKACAGMSCERAANDYLDALNGQGRWTGCDLMMIVYNGIEETDYFTGSFKWFSKLVGGFLHLAMNAVQVSSAWMTLYYNQSDAWNTTEVQLLSNKFATASKRMASKLRTSKSNMAATIGQSTSNWMQRHGQGYQQPNWYICRPLLTVLTDNYPGFYWTAICSDRGFYTSCEGKNTLHLWPLKSTNACIYFIPTDSLPRDKNPEPRAWYEVRGVSVTVAPNNYVPATLIPANFNVRSYPSTSRRRRDGLEYVWEVFWWQKVKGSAASNVSIDGNPVAKVPLLV